MLTSTRREFLVNTTCSVAVSAFLQVQRASFASESDIVDDTSLARRKHDLEILKQLLWPTRSEYKGRINAYDKTWEDSLGRTGELPPDFSTMPSTALLPDPLIMLNNQQSPIKTEARWQMQRELIKAQFEKWIFGKMPPPPGNVRGVITATRNEGDATVQDVRLDFGPEHRATLSLELLIPPGDGPFPLLLTNHPRRRPWVNTAMRRGYMGCIYYANDWTYGKGDESDAWIDLYPEYDFSCIARWAWGAMRAVDYLVTLPIVNQSQIAIGGHSRNSKQALLAAAFDERIAAVVPSRGNSGDQLPWRYNTEMYVSEPLEEITNIPHWFHPRLRFFVGREHKLPVDQHMLLALVAPRGLLMSHAYTEHQGNAFAFEQSYRSTRRVYQLLGKENMLGMYQQPGEHPSSVEDIEQYFDFFDSIFGRKEFGTPQIWVHGYSFEQWRQRSKESIDALTFPERTIEQRVAVKNIDDLKIQQRITQDRIRWVLGDEPPGVPLPDRKATKSSYTNISNGWRGQLFQRPFKHGGPVGGRGFVFGDDLRGDFYYPQGGPRSGKWPAVVWLHPYSYAMGYARYDYWGHLVRKGFAVVGFDQIGFGVRSGQALRF